MDKHLMRTAGLAAIGMLALSGCGAGGSTDADASASPTEDKPICQQEASEATTIDSAPEVEWVEHDGRPSTPKSEDLGPAEEKDGIGTCYRHSPEGALVASADFISVIMSFDADEVNKLTQEHATGADRDKITEDFQRLEDTYRGTETKQIIEGMKVAGYKVESYSKDRAVISLAYSMEAQGAHHEISFALPLTWQDDDWSFAADAYGDSSEDLTGYTPWAPRRSASSPAPPPPPGRRSPPIRSLTGADASGPPSTPECHTAGRSCLYQQADYSGR